MLSDTSLIQLNNFFNHYKPLRYKKRDLILHANDNQSCIFYIKSGYVRVYRLSEHGEELTLTILKPHDFFPLTYGIHSRTNPYYLEAITPLELWKSPQDQFTQFIKLNPDIYVELTSSILIRFDGVLSRMEYLVFSNAYTKVAATILICAKRFGKQKNDDFILQVPLTHKDIATLVGITRETTSLALKKLEKQGFLTRTGRFLVVKHIKQLEEAILLTPEEDATLANSL